MSETGTLLTGYLLPVAVGLDLIVTVIGGIFVLASVVALFKSISRRHSNRVETLKWRLGFLGYVKTWTLLFVAASVCGTVISLIIGQKLLFYGNVFLGVFFFGYFVVASSAYRFALREYESAKSILGS